MRLTLSILCFSFLLASSAFAEPEFQTNLTRNKMNTAETSTFSVEIKWPKSEAKYQFAFPPFNLLENLTLLRQGESQESFVGVGGEWVRKTFNFEIQGKKNGQAKIPGFDLTYVDPGTQNSGQLLIPAQTLSITKKMNNKFIFIILGLLIFAAGLAARLRKLFGRWNEPGEETSSLPVGASNIENFKIFIESHSVLNHLFSAGLTPHLKQFLAEAYGVPSEGHTIDVSQTLQQLEIKGLSRDEIYDIKNILNVWEEINYAGRVSDLEFREFRTQLLRLIQNKKAVPSLI